jgi:hypothetical protein
MSRFAETAILYYRLSFADQGKRTFVSVCSKQTEVCRFRFPFAENKRNCRFLFAEFRKHEDM